MNRPFARNPHYKSALLLALNILLYDQLSKMLLLSHYGLPERGTVEVTPFFNLVSVWNHGISFGLFSRAGHEATRWVLIAIAAGISGVLYVWLRRAETLRASLAIGLVIGGAIGNVIDRLRLGAVYDFLDFHAAGVHWPAFNLADSAICIGVTVLCLDNLFTPRPKDEA